MRWLFFLAGLLSIGTGLIHAVMGGIDTLNPLMASAISMEVRVTMMAVWHGTTIFFILSAFGFFWAFAADRANACPVGVLLGSFYVLFAGVFAALSFMWFENPLALPQWTLLAPIGLFALAASL